MRAVAKSLSVRSGLVALCLSISGCFGGPTDEAAAVEEPEGLSVNAFLWAASLDTLDFLPVRYSDPRGGVLAFDWYADPRKPNERFRVDVYILDRRLRADALRASVFKQTLSGNAWRDAEVAPGTAAQIENAILTRARQLKLSEDEG